MHVLIIANNLEFGRSGSEYVGCEFIFFMLKVPSFGVEENRSKTLSRVGMVTSPPLRLVKVGIEF